MLEILKALKEDITRTIQNFDFEEFRGNMRMFFEWIKEKIEEMKK